MRGEDLHNLLRALAVRLGGDAEVSKEEFLRSLDYSLQITSVPQDDVIYVRAWPGTGSKTG